MLHVKSWEYLLIYIIQKLRSPILRPTLFSDVSLNKLAGVYVLCRTMQSVYE